MNNQSPNSAEIIPIRRTPLTQELCRNYLIIRNFHLPRLTLAEHRTLRAMEEFLMNGGLTEDECVRHNNEVLKRMLQRLAKPDGWWRRLINWLNEPAAF